MQDLLNHLFFYQDGKIFWAIEPRRGFNKSGQEAGTLNKGRVYVKSKLLPKRNFARSQIVWIMHNGPIPDGFLVDHINRNTQDDRIENLRLLTKSQNYANTEGKNTKKSGLPKGVYKCSVPGTYRFRVVRKGQEMVSTGLSLEEAERAASEFFKQEGLYS